MFLITGHKIILFGYLSILFFYFLDKNKRFIYIIISINLLLICSIIIFQLLEIPIIPSLIIRRVFFLPPLLEKFYLEHYDELLFYKYSFLKGLFGFEKSITKEIGYYYFDNPEINANIGLIVEGFLSLGIVGVFLHAIIIAYMFRYINFQNIESAYFGIIFVMMYVLNTSFIFPYMLTHGFVALLLLASFINRKQTGYKFTKL